MIECGWIARPQAVSIPAYALRWATIFATLRRVVWITRAGLPRCSILERPMPFAAFSSMHRGDGGGAFLDAKQRRRQSRHITVPRTGRLIQKEIVVAWPGAQRG